MGSNPTPGAKHHVAITNLFRNQTRRSMVRLCPRLGPSRPDRAQAGRHAGTDLAGSQRGRPVFREGQPWRRGSSQSSFRGMGT